MIVCNGLDRVGFVIVLKWPPFPRGPAPGQVTANQNNVGHGGIAEFGHGRFEQAIGSVAIPMTELHKRVRLVFLDNA